MQHAMNWWDPLASWAAEKSNGYLFDAAVTTTATPTTTADKIEAEFQALTLVDPTDTVAAMDRLQIPGYATVIYGGLALRRHSWKLCLQMAGKLESRHATTHAAAAVLYQLLFEYFALAEKTLLDWPLGARNALHTWIQQFQWSAGPLGRQQFTQGFQSLADQAVGSLLRDVCLYAVRRFQASQPCSLAPKPTTGPPSLTAEQRAQLEDLVVILLAPPPASEAALPAAPSPPVAALVMATSTAEPTTQQILAEPKPTVKVAPSLPPRAPSPEPQEGDEDEDMVDQEGSDQVLVDGNDDDNEDDSADNDDEVVVADDDEEDNDEAVAEVVGEESSWPRRHRSESEEEADDQDNMESEGSSEPRREAAAVETDEDAIQILDSDEEDDDDDDVIDSEEDHGSYGRQPYQSEEDELHDSEEDEHQAESGEDQYGSDLRGGEDAPIELDEDDDEEVAQEGSQDRGEETVEDVYPEPRPAEEEDEGADSNVSEEAPEDSSPPVVHPAEPDGDENYYATAEESQEDDDELVQNLSQDESAIPPSRIFPPPQEPSDQRHVRVDAPPIQPIQPTPHLDDGYLPEDDQGHTEDEMNMPPPLRARRHHERDGYQGGESSLGHTEEEDEEISEAAEDEDEHAHLPETMENGAAVLQAPPALDSHSLSGMSAADERGPEEEYSELEEANESGEQVHFPPTHSVESSVKPKSTSLVDYALASAQQEMPESRKQRRQQSSDISHRPYVDSPGLYSHALSEDDDSKVAANPPAERELIRIAEGPKGEERGESDEHEGDEGTVMEGEAEELEDHHHADHSDEPFVESPNITHTDAAHASVETVEVLRIGATPEISDTIQIEGEKTADDTLTASAAADGTLLKDSETADLGSGPSEVVNSGEIQIEDTGEEDDKVEVLDSVEAEPVVASAPREEIPIDGSKAGDSMPVEPAGALKFDDDVEGMAVETIGDAKAVVESDVDQNKMAEEEILDDMATEKEDQADAMLDDADQGVENMEADDENDEMAVDEVDKEEIMVIDDGDVEMDAANESIVLDEEMRDETVGMDAARAASSYTIESTMSVDEVVEKPLMSAPDEFQDPMATNSSTPAETAADTKECQATEAVAADVEEEKLGQTENPQIDETDAKAEEAAPLDDDVIEVVEEDEEASAEDGTDDVGLLTLPAALEPIPEDEDQEPQPRPSFLATAADPASLFQTKGEKVGSVTSEHDEKPTSKEKVVSEVPPASLHTNNQEEDSTTASSKKQIRRPTRASAAKRGASDTESVEPDSKRATDKNAEKDETSITTPKKKSGVQDAPSVGSRSTRRSARLASKTPAPAPAVAHHDDDDVSVLSEGTEVSAPLAVEPKTTRPRRKKNKGSDEESHTSAPSKTSTSVRPRRAKNPPATPSRGADESLDSSAADLVARRTRSATKATTPDTAPRGAKSKRGASSASRITGETEDDEAESRNSRQRTTRNTRSKTSSKKEEAGEDAGDAGSKSSRKRNTKKPPPPPSTRNLRSRK
eukprot:scaffold2742_cov167-Amphora_coffeaeformis.AAC.2